MDSLILSARTESPCSESASPHSSFRRTSVALARCLNNFNSWSTLLPLSPDCLLIPTT